MTILAIVVSWFSGLWFGDMVRNVHKLHVDPVDVMVPAFLGLLLAVLAFGVASL
jgi:hypothetical protein